MGSTYNGSKNRYEVGQTLAVAERKGLPKEQSPAEKQEHVAGSLVECCDAHTGGLGQRYEHRINRAHGDASKPGVPMACRQDMAGSRSWGLGFDWYIQVLADQGHELTTGGPVERIVRVVGRRRVQDNVATAGMACVHVVVQVDEVDSAWDGWSARWGAIGGCHDDG